MSTQKVMNIANNEYTQTYDMLIRKRKVITNS